MESKIKTVSEFEVEGVKYRLIFPNVTTIRDANFKHRKAFTDALKNGFYTKKKLELILQEGDINVIKNHVDRRAEILKQYYDASVLVDKAETSENLEFLAEILRTHRESFVQEDMSMNSLFANTAEQLAEDERVNYLCSRLIRHDDYSPVWDTYEDYLDDNNYVFIERCKYEVLKWDYNLAGEDTESQPEFKALKKAESIRKAAEEKEKEESVTKEVIEEKVETPVEGSVAKTKVRKSSRQVKPNKRAKRRVVADGESIS
jgi:hypothetical protein